MIDFAVSLRTAIRKSLAAANTTDTRKRALPQTPEDWLALMDLGYAHWIVDKIEENIPFNPQIIGIAVDDGGEEYPPCVILELVDGGSITIGLEDLILAFSPSH